MKFILLIEVCQRKSVNIINQSWTILKFVEEFVTNGRIILFSQLLKEMNAIVKKTGEVFRLIGCTIIDDLTTA